MLLRNELLHYSHPQPRTLRVLWIAPALTHAFVFDVAALSAEVELVAIIELQADLASGRARVLPGDPYLVLPSQEMLPASHVRLRDRAWKIIEALTLHEPQIYQPRLRGPLIAQAMQAHGVSHPTVYRYLRRYWQRGQTPNALLPDYGNSGGRGKVRAASEGVKRGRPRKDGADPGLNADQDIRRVFRVATARYADSHPRFSRQGAYQQMLRDFFCQRVIEPVSGRISVPDGAGTPAPRAPVPTFGQFNYWLDQDHDRPPQVSRRAATPASASASTPGPGAMLMQAMPAMLASAPPGPAGAAGTGFASDIAASMAALPPGRPGSSYYLDAVRAELQLVSRADRQQAIGRPLLYLAVDSFSRMVTGFYISLEPLSWQHAVLALAHCGADKPRYCRQFGRTIDAGQWPSQHLPEALFARPALMRGWSGDALLNNFNLRCLAVEQGPDDWQAVLKKRFRLLAPDAPGTASRLDGVLDVEQFTRIVIDALVYYNNHHALAHAGGAVPRQLWEWGAAHRGGGLKTCPEQLLRCSLLPLAYGTVTADGIRLRDTYYTCARAIDERWFARARLRGEWQVRLACDSANLDLVYLLDAAAPLQFHLCHIAERSSMHRRLSAAEAAAMPTTGPAPASAAVQAPVPVPAPAPAAAPAPAVAATATTWLAQPAMAFIAG